MENNMNIHEDIIDINDNEALATAIFDATSDGYDDEEYRGSVTPQLIDELATLENDSTLRYAILEMVKRIEEYQG